MTYGDDDADYPYTKWGDWYREQIAVKGWGGGPQANHPVTLTYWELHLHLLKAKLDIQQLKSQK